MKAFVGVTDGQWHRFLAARPDIREVNFWQPGGGRGFNALQRGEPFIFKSKWADGNKLIGGGYFEGFVHLTVSDAWEFFGEGNGVDSFDEMRQQIGRYRQHPIASNEDPVIGCILLNEVRFIDSSRVVDTPLDFSPNIVTGKSYVVGERNSNPVIDLFVREIALAVEVKSDLPHPRMIDGPVFGEPRLIVPRLGQGGFKSLVREAYERRCAVTGHKIVPTLQAAHIVPVSANGEHRLDNGLLLRSDIHTMFDRGYVGVSPDFTLRVSPSLRSEFGNGDEFYARQGEMIALPRKEADRPNTTFLEWHMDTVFRGS
jgi:putative restriction endonuclease